MLPATLCIIAEAAAIKVLGRAAGRQREMGAYGRPLCPRPRLAAVAHRYTDAHGNPIGPTVNIIIDGDQPDLLCRGLILRFWAIPSALPRFGRLSSHEPLLRAAIARHQILQSLASSQRLIRRVARTPFHPTASESACCPYCWRTKRRCGGSQAAKRR